MIDTKKEKKDDEDLFWESEKKTLEKKVKQNAGSLLLFSKVFFTPKEEVSCFPNTNRDHRDHRHKNKEDEKKEKEENIASS